MDELRDSDDAITVLESFETCETINSAAVSTIKYAYYREGSYGLKSAQEQGEVGTDYISCSSPQIFMVLDWQISTSLREVLEEITIHVDIQNQQIKQYFETKYADCKSDQFIGIDVVYTNIVSDSCDTMDMFEFLIELHRQGQSEAINTVYSVEMH